MSYSDQKKSNAIALLMSFGREKEMCTKQMSTARSIIEVGGGGCFVAKNRPPHPCPRSSNRCRRLTILIIELHLITIRSTTDSSKNNVQFIWRAVTTDNSPQRSELNKSRLSISINIFRRIQRSLQFRTSTSHVLSYQVRLGLFFNTGTSHKQQLLQKNSQPVAHRPISANSKTKM